MANPTLAEKRVALVEQSLTCDFLFPPNSNVYLMETILHNLPNKMKKYGAKR